MSVHAGKYAHIVKELLLQRTDLTTATMIDAGFGWRLAAVIFYLRKQGWPILTELDMRRVAHYKLPAGWSPESLKVEDNGD